MRRGRERRARSSLSLSVVPAGSKEAQSREQPGRGCVCWWCGGHSSPCTASELNGWPAARVAERVASVGPTAAASPPRARPFSAVAVRRKLLSRPCIELGERAKSVFPRRPSCSAARQVSDCFAWQMHAVRSGAQLNQRTSVQSRCQALCVLCTDRYQVTLIVIAA